MQRSSSYDGKFLLPTPVGAYYCVASKEKNPIRQLLITLISKEQSQKLSLERLEEWTNITQDDVKKILQRLKKLGWIEGFDMVQSAPSGALEDVLPEILPVLSGTEKVLLADAQGFSIVSHGFSDETAERLSAVSADLASLRERHRRLIESELKLPHSAWSLVSGKGNSKIGFWPMYFGNSRFVLIVEGKPYFNQSSMTQLVWALNKRYGE